ncbi:hypothetical protein [Trichormus variabilis]|uniref:Uncharacterized protein n=1 Tax=Trichormus variabilis SAG 1403-4b TaxID=447716 RepID=A0A3S1C6I0_ANAVA|nr:hypothetical protein [Trichormus variabilis]RUS97831.1 hypothetical protein DSM107003_17060 [Trichormus variabilis SAG 1403-4b]
MIIEQDSVNSETLLSCSLLRVPCSLPTQINSEIKPDYYISEKRLEEINNIPDEDIDTCDIPELDAHFWENAKLVKPITKQAISLRIDDDVLQWF